jgi:hypothetical protein
LPPPEYLLPLIGLRCTAAEAGTTAIQDGDALNFVPADMVLPWFEQGGVKKQAADVAADIDSVLTLTSGSGPVVNMPLYFVNTSAA